MRFVIMGNKKKKEIKYNYLQIVRCAKCGVEAEEPGPCFECKNQTFVPVFILQEIGVK